MNPKVIVIVLALVLCSCIQEHRVLVLEQKTELLRQPYPLNYPSSAPISNSIVRVLSPENVTILSDSYRKDFHVYQVRDSLGNTGYNWSTRNERNTTLMRLMRVLRATAFMPMSGTILSAVGTGLELLDVCKVVLHPCHPRPDQVRRSDRRGTQRARPQGADELRKGTSLGP